MPNSTNTTLFALLIALAAGCASAPEPVTEAPPAETTEQAEPKPVEAPPARVHETLNAVLWQQTSPEYDATARGAYALARTNLDRALKDKTWTAALEQGEGFAKKKPALIVDVDETVLDNSAYQARLVADDASYDTESWNAWCHEAKAVPVPGALDFAKYAADKGVTVFYVTNRAAEVEEPTMKNLVDLGFPVAEGVDVLLTKGEQPEWGSDKTPRRAKIAEDYRIVMLVGDNLGDFIGEGAKGAPDARVAAAEAHADWWGSRWIMLPNPMYGYWEAAPFGYDYGAAADAKFDAKLEALDQAR